MVAWCPTLTFVRYTAHALQGLQSTQIELGGNAASSGVLTSGVADGAGPLLGCAASLAAG